MVRQVDGACSSISINTSMLGVAQKSEGSPKKSLKQERKMEHQLNNLSKSRHASLLMCESVQNRMATYLMAMDEVTTEQDITSADDLSILHVDTAWW